MKNSRRSLFALLAAAVSAGSCSTPKQVITKPLVEASHAEVALRSTAAVNVSSFGSTDGAARFVLALEQELIDQGFRVVADPKTADLVLSGAFEQIWRIDKIQTNATLRGNTASGERVWGGSFPPPVFLYPSNDQTNRLVVSIVNQLRYDVDELQKKYR